MLAEFGFPPTVADHRRRSAPPFEHDGEQFVIAYSAGNLFAGTPRGDSVWLFSLSGTLDEARPAGSEPVITEAEHE